MLCPNWALNIKTDRGVNEANSEIFYLNFASFPFTVIVEFFPKDFTCTAAYLACKKFVICGFDYETLIFYLYMAFTTKGSSSHKIFTPILNL